MKILRLNKLLLEKFPVNGNMIVIQAEQIWLDEVGDDLYLVIQDENGNWGVQ